MAMMNDSEIVRQRLLCQSADESAAPAEQQEKQHVGWREWVAFPELGIPAVKAKLDTGARTSVLHAFSVETFERDGRLMVRFGIHPLQRRTDLEIFCVAEVVDRRLVCDSGGHSEWRPVIRSPINIGKSSWEVEINLTNRDPMLFRLLLGRTALCGRALVDPAASFLTGRRLARSYRQATRVMKR
jgi:hypothetical protein